MVPLTALWLPILVSGAFVFIGSSIIHMALGYHRSDCDRLATEDQLMDAMRKVGVPPGDYFLPHAGSMAVMKSPEFQAKVEKGPVLVMTVLKGKGTPMGQRLLQRFIFLLVVSLFAGYVAGARSVRARPRCKSSVSPRRWRSPATFSESGRTRSGGRASGRRRSRTRSTAWSTRC